MLFFVLLKKGCSCKGHPFFNKTKSGNSLAKNKFLIELKSGIGR